MKKKIKEKKPNLEKENKKIINEADEATHEETSQIKEDKQDLSREIDTLKQQLEEAEDSKLRALAEAENMRRRMEKEKQENARYGPSNLARGLFTILDNFDRALLASPKELENKKDTEKNYLALHEGVELTLKDISAVFKQNGIEIIAPKKGDVFDHNFHQAMLEIPTDDYKPGCVCEVLQSGYKIYDRLLRPAMVGVSKDIIKE